MRRIPLLLALVVALAAAVPAFGFELPGLAEDSSQYGEELRRRAPAGGTPQGRAQAEARASQAERQGQWAAAAQAWEARIAAGESTGDIWLALAQAHLNRTPPEATRALHAGWQAFMMVPGGPPEIPSLLVMAEALRRLDRPVPYLEALQAVVERAPENAQHRAALAEARRRAGLLVRRIATEPDAEPARACLAFTTPPARRTDWRPEDWVRAEPPLPALAVERDGDQICVAGLPWGRRTRLVLRAGLPGEDDLRLARDTAYDIAMPNRASRIAFDTRAFLLPRGQAPQVTVATVNVAALSLRLVRVAERNLVPLTRDWRLGDTMEGWLAETLHESWGRVVWEGRADLPPAEANRLTRASLALPEALRSAGPGLYVLVARSGDGRPMRGVTAAALPIIATDLALTAWRGADGIAAQLRGLADAAAKPGVRLALMARNNEVLGEAETDTLGLVRFPAALLRGRGPLAPVALHAQAGEDLVVLDLEAAAFDLSDRGATGQAHPGPLDAFVWLDRGIYRPGETVQVAALLRDAGGAPVDIPARLRLRRPNGQVAAEAVPPRVPGTAVTWPVTLSAGAAVGAWTVEVLADPDAPPIGRASFKVEAFVPERLEVTLGPAPGPLVPATPMRIPVVARFLYGAPGAGLSGSADLRLSVDPEPFPAWRGWRFGLQSESFAPDLLSFDLPETDADGRATLAVTLPAAPDTTRPLRASLALTVQEPGGRGSSVGLDIPVRAAGTLVAIRPLFDGEAMDDGAEAGFEVAAVAPDGAAVATALRARLVRERPDWRIVVRERLARYETVWRDELVDSAELRVGPGQPGRFARRLPFGRYRLEVTEPSGLGMASMRFRAGWAGMDAAEVPDRVDLAADRQAYAPGEVARLRITPPFGGRASLAILTDRLVLLREIEVPEGGAEVEVPVDPAWGPGAYVAVTVFRPGESRQGRPGRALGLAWLGLDPGLRRLEVAIEAPDLARPRGRVEVPVRVGNSRGQAMLTLAAVDEGILRLTRFPSPDPAAHFLGKRKLGLDIRDDYGRLIAPAEGDAAVLRQGGDEGGGLVQPIPQRLVALFSGPVAVGPDGTARVPLDLPDFAGELRLMVVAWDGNRMGAAAKPMTVRDPLVAEALLPRFLAPGDEVRLPLLLHNLELPDGDVVVRLTASAGLELSGPAELPLRLTNGARAQPATQLRATTTGEGLLRLSVTGPQGFALTRESVIPIRSSRPMVTELATSTLLPGQQAALLPPSQRFVPGSWRATASWGGAVGYDPAALLRALRDYPFDCTEQAASRLMGLLHGPAAPEAAEEIAARRQSATALVLDRQRYDGSFGLWSAEGPSQPWLTAYAAEALWRARALGVPVPEGALDAALRSLEEELESGARETPELLAAQTYRLHVLAMAGRHRLGAARRLLELMDQLPTPLARAQLGSAFARAGDRPRAEAAFAAALAAPARRPWLADFGSATRDILAMTVLLKESGVALDALPRLLARLPGADLRPEAIGTQEQAWAITAAGVLGRDSRPLRLTLDGRDLPMLPIVTVRLSGPATARNLTDAPVPQGISVTGLPAHPLPAQRAGMRVSRRFFDLAGQPLDLDQLRQATGFVLLLEGQAEMGEAHRAMLQQGLPAGWEIAARLGPGAVPGMPWLGDLSEPVAQPALDDRFAAAMELTAEQAGFRLAVRLRAVTAGRFELPGAELADMYRPGVFARQSTGRVTVLPAD